MFTFNDNMIMLTTVMFVTPFNLFQVTQILLFLELLNLDKDSLLYFLVVNVILIDNCMFHHIPFGWNFCCFLPYQRRLWLIYVYIALTYRLLSVTLLTTPMFLLTMEVFWVSYNPLYLSIFNYIPRIKVRCLWFSLTNYLYIM